jgi:hypothetical protein
MISKFDDYAVHQNFSPVNEPGPSDRNFYDRYWFNGFETEGGFTFEVGLGIYPNRFVQDGHFGVVIDGVQHCFHGSRRAPKERTDTSVGPLRVEIIEPLRVVRIVLEESLINTTPLACDLTFEAVTAPTQEPENLMYDDGRLIMKNTRFTQFGRWRGFFSVDGRRIEVDSATTHGTRDRSWGIRPVGESEAGAPTRLNAEPSVYWSWMPIHFDDMCTQFGSFEDPDGNPTQLSACMVPRYHRVDQIPEGEEPGHKELEDISHTNHFETGTRRPARSELHFTAPDGGLYDVELEPLIRFYMLGVGYQHPEWGHGFWKGEVAHTYESFSIDDLDPLDYKHIHLHTICRAKMAGPDRERIGVGIVETVVFGRHTRSGFRELLDGAP